MLSFFIRFLIVLLALIFCLGFASSFFSIPFILAVIFVCSWIFIRSFHEIFWEISIFALIYDFLTTNHTGIYFFLILIFALTFDFLKRFVFKVSEGGIFLAYFSTILLSISIVIVFYLQKNWEFSFFFVFKQILNYALISVVFFFVFFKIIDRLERIISFYTQKIDIKRHI